LGGLKSSIERTNYMFEYLAKVERIQLAHCGDEIRMEVMRLM